MPAGAETDAAHVIAWTFWEQQARLPLRLGGCGLRDSRRTSMAAYWASVADPLPVIRARFPMIAAHVVEHLVALAISLAAPRASPSLASADAAARRLDEAGWAERPSWRTLVQGQAPAQLAAPDPVDEDAQTGPDPGELAHG